MNTSSNRLLADSKSSSHGRLIYQHPQTGKPPSHSATPELLQLLTSSFDRMFKSFLTRNDLVDS
jgi:hypothetical protein